MQSVGMTALNGRLSEYVRLAAAGETVLITEGDRVVAEIRPPRETVPNDWLTAPVMSADSTPPTSDPVAPLHELVAELQEDRDESGADRFSR